MAPREDYCKTCGLFAPCPTCGKGRAALGVVREPAYTEEQIRSAVASALCGTRAGPDPKVIDEVIATLKEGGS